MAEALSLVDVGLVAAHVVTVALALVEVFVDGIDFLKVVVVVFLVGRVR